MNEFLLFQFTIVFALFPTAITVAVPMSTASQIALAAAIIFIIILICAAIYLVRRLRREQAKSEEHKKTKKFLFERGKVEEINPDMTAGEQAELLPYDKSFEVERSRIKIGE